MTTSAETLGLTGTAPKVAFRTFGCKLNLYETAGMQQGTRRRGYAVVSNDADADIVVVNTCSVTGRADQEARQYIRSVHRRVPRARVVVTGCYAQRAPQEIKDLPGVALVAGHREKDVLETLLAGLPDTGPARVEVGSLEGNPMTTLRAIGLEERTRALLRVQDGCDCACTYCVIPQTRGGSRSHTLESVLDEARRLLDTGHREMVLTGTHLGHYGLDLKPRRRLSELVEALITLPSPHRFRVRLSSVEPQEIDARMVELLAASDVLAPHLHLPLQSGSDVQLRRMRRSYRTPVYRRRVLEVASRVPRLGLGADLILGFPGETEGDFRETLAFLNDLPFTYLHPFTYSPRPNTPAASWSGRPPGDMSARRLAAANALVAAKHRMFRQSRIGDPVTVLVEETRADGMSQGLDETYVRVRFPARKNLVGRFALVRVTGLQDDGLVGDMIEGIP